MGCPLGTAAFIDSFGERHVAKARTLLARILELPDLQHAWLLVYFCIVPRANHLHRRVPPSLAQAFAAGFDDLTETGLRELLQRSGTEAIPPHTLQQARLPFREGGLGLRDCAVLSHAAYWSSWADT